MNGPLAADGRQSRSILLIAYFFPPSVDTGAHRPTSMARHLARLGHRVTVLTTGVYGEGNEPPEVEVERAWDLQLLRARLTGGKRVAGVFEGDRHPSGRPRLINYFVVPEPLALTWAPFALARALRLNRRERFDCVITTSPPESNHLVGWALRRRGVPWVADIRDAWNYESLRPRLPTGIQRRLDHWLEARTMRAADVVACNTMPVVDDLRERLGVEAVRVSSGWEPELLDSADTDPGIELDPERLSVVYTGRFATYARDPAGLFQALREIAAEEPRLAERLELVFAGPYTDEERAVLEGDLGALKVRLIGSIERRRAFALQRRADALLLVERRRQAANIKLFEYIGSGRPIIALSEGTAGGEIVSETGAGIVASPSDPTAIRNAFRSFAERGLPVASESARRSYAYPLPAERMAEQVELAIARAGRR
jgi:glycosyltransferase involved in cell wall biosynthesis